LTKIDEWQKMMMEKVRIVADHTRTQVLELLNLKRVRLNNDFERFSDELFDLKQTENFVEHDLSRLKYMIHQFNQELKQINKPVTIALHTEWSDRLVWSRLIYAVEKSTYARIQQQQQQKQEEGRIE
jgi:transcriptional antiterminator